MRSIKLLAIAGLLMGLGLSVNAADNYLANFKAGKWQGTVADSVSADLKGKKMTATTATMGDAVTVTVKTEGDTGQEVWKITPTQLVQTEYDATGKTLGTYTADLKKDTTTATTRTFEIHCADRAAGKCDNNINPKNNWVLTVAGGKFTYIVNGLKDKTNPNSYGQRHRFEFNYSGN